MAVNVRFFQRHRRRPGGRDHLRRDRLVRGNVVQAILLILLLVFSEATLTWTSARPGRPGIKHLPSC